MKKVIIASVAAVFMLTGCNAVKGLGKDISKGGQAVTNTAQEVQTKM